MTFGEDGKATVSLEAGQSVTISGLPAGVGYTVTEDTSKITGTCEVWVNGQESTTTSGTITQNETAEVTFNNHFETGDLVVSKTVSGTDADTSKEFSFTIQLDLEDFDGTFAAGTYGDMTFDEYGKATFTLKHGETATATGRPSGIGYTVTESDYSGDGYTTTVTTVGNTSSEEPTTASGTIAEHGTTTVAFNNSKEATTGDLVISKTVSGTAADTSKEFTFTVTLTDSDNQTITGDISVIYSDDPTNTVTLSSNNDDTYAFTLKHGQSVTILDLPDGTQYTVTEADYSSEGYETTANLSDSRTASGAISVGATSVAGFQNHKDLEPKLNIKKTTTDGSTSAQAGEEVEYILTVTQTVEHAIAKNVVVEDELPAGLSYVDDVADTAVVKIGDRVVGNATVEASGQTLTVTGIEELSYGETLTITYSVTVDEGTEGQSLTNTATVTSDEIPEGPSSTWTVEVPEDNGDDPEDSPEGDASEEDPTGDPEEETDDGDSDSDDDDNTATTEDDATTDETDDDDTVATSILSQTGDSIGALLSFTAALALAALATVAASALALRRRRIKE